MNDTIAFWLNYIGGVDLLYLMWSILAFTQMVKMAFKAIGVSSPDAVRPFPYLFGAFFGWVFVEYSARGAMIGVSAGMIASLCFYALTAWLNRSDAPNWQKDISTRLSLK